MGLDAVHRAYLGLDMDQTREARAGMGRVSPGVRVVSWASRIGNRESRRGNLLFARSSVLRSESPFGRGCPVKIGA